MSGHVLSSEVVKERVEEKEFTYLRVSWQGQLTDVPAHWFVLALSLRVCGPGCFADPSVASIQQEQNRQLTHSAWPWSLRLYVGQIDHSLFHDNFNCDKVKSSPISKKQYLLEDADSSVFAKHQKSFSFLNIFSRVTVTENATRVKTCQAEW